MLEINFSSNQHGKLLLPIFGDVRYHDDDRFQLGNVFEVKLNKASLGYAKVVAVRTFRFVQITDTFSFMNCGRHAAYQAAILKNMYGSKQSISNDTPFMHVVFQWTQRNMAVHSDLFKDLWKSIEEQQPHYSGTTQPIDNA